MNSVFPENNPVASNCIDGVTTYANCQVSNQCHPYLCITWNHNKDWLVITVTGYSVDKVVVYNRLYGAQELINNAKLIYSNDFEGTSIIYQSSFGSSASAVYTFDFNKVVTYVRIQQTTNELINLVEVELYNKNNKIPLSGSLINIIIIIIIIHHYHHHSIISSYELGIPRE